MAKCADDESDIIIGNGVPLFVIKVTETNPLPTANGIITDDKIYTITVKDSDPEGIFIIENLNDLRTLEDDETCTSENINGREMTDNKKDYVFKFSKVISSLSTYLKIYTNTYNNHTSIIPMGMVRHIEVYDYEIGKNFIMHDYFRWILLYSIYGYINDISPYVNI